MREKMNCNFSQVDTDAIIIARNLCSSILQNLGWQGADDISFCRKGIGEEEIRTYSVEEIHAFIEFLGYLKDMSTGHINAYAEGEDE